MRKLVVAAMIAMTGCSSAPQSISALQKANYKDSFLVNKNYQETYRNFKTRFSMCGGLDASWLKPFAVHSELYTDIGEGQITLNLTPPVGVQRPIKYIRIKKMSDLQSEVIIYHAGQYELDNSKTIYRRWANGDPVCE